MSVIDQRSLLLKVSTVIVVSGGGVQRARVTCQSQGRQTETDEYDHSHSHPWKYSVSTGSHCRCLGLWEDAGALRGSVLDVETTATVHNQQNHVEQPSVSSVL